MFCAKCGAVLAENAKKCQKCGAPVRIRPAGAKKNVQKNKKTRVPEERERIPSPEDLEEGFREEEFMDPVFFEEADENVDVDAIIRIARGKDPGTAPGKDPLGTMDQGDSGLDMPTYLESLPLMEKARRKLAASLHRRAEAADERRMRRQIQRAEKFYDRQELEAYAETADRTEDDFAADREREEAARREQESRAQAEREARIRADREREEAARREQESRAQAEREARIRADREREEAARRQREEAARTAAAQTLQPGSPAERPGGEYTTGSDRVWSKEEIRLETARRLRRYRDEETDGLDRFLGKYGLSKDTAVRLATLFLIAVLSLIYVLGGGGRDTTGTMQAGGGMTAAPADQEPGSGGETQDQELPTGGGDFSNTESDTE